MSPRIKEEERIEKIIRGLLKLQENRRCINCNSLGPQYVCTTFWTFVCTKCSGLHREFTHRVKSVSMAKFNAEEVSSLEAGGNERAREIYFKTWDSQRNVLPDGSNLHRLRDFIKHVYVERKFTGDRNVEKLAMVKTDFKDGFYEKRSYSTTGYKDYNDRCSFDPSISRGGYEPKNLRTLLDERSPYGSPGRRQCRPNASFEVVDDRYRRDGSRNVRRYEIHRSVSAGQTRGSSSPVSRKIREIILPEVRSVREILGDSVPPLKVGEATEEKPEVSDSSTVEKEAAACSSPPSTGGKQAEHKTERSIGLIDFDTNDDAVYEHPDSSMASHREETSSTNGENSLSLPQTQQEIPEKASPKPRSVSFMESLLLELAAPVEAPSNGANASETATNYMGNVLRSPSNNGDLSVEVSDEKHSPDTPQQHTSAKDSYLSTEVSSDQHSWPPEFSNSQEQAPSNQLSWPSPSPNSQPESNSQAPTYNASAEKYSEIATKQPQETNSEDASKPSARKELPEDIFAALYSSYTAPVPYRQVQPDQGMGTGMSMDVGMPHYPAPVPGISNTSTSKPMNPFDLGNDTPQAQNPMFPSMVSLQGALPYLSAQMGLQPQPSPPNIIGMPPGVQMGQPPPNSMQIPRPQENSKTNSGEAAFASLNPFG